MSSVNGGKTSAYAIRTGSATACTPECQRQKNAVTAIRLIIRQLLQALQLIRWMFADASYKSFAGARGLFLAHRDQSLIRT